MELQRNVFVNILGKATRARAKDTINHAFVPRFLKGNPPDAWKIVRPLEDKNFPIEILKPVYYWITARSERILYDFAIEELWMRIGYADPAISTKEVVAWVRSKLVKYNQLWSHAVTQKVAQGILAALRDFGILEGRARKKIAPTYLPIESFGYLAFILNSLEFTGSQLVNHPDWRFFLLPLRAVESLFLEAHQRRYLSYAAAGNVIRVDFAAKTMEEMADVILRRMV
jgi:hypothetical protein